MKQTINSYQFQEAFKSCGRGEQFSYNGLNALFDFIEELDDSCGTETELDVIALCCEFSEYNNIVEAFKAYDFKPWDDEDEDAQTEEALRYFEEHTAVIQFDGGVIIQDF